MNGIFMKEAKSLLTDLNSRKNAIESIQKKIACGEGGLEERLRKVKTDVEVTERAFAGLTYKERDILSAFYIDREKKAADRLCVKYGCGRSTVYRIKRAAMHEFTLRVFGDV